MITDLSRSIGILGIVMLFASVAEIGIPRWVLGSLAGAVVTLAVLLEITLDQCERRTLALIEEHVGKLATEHDRALAKIDELHRRLAAKKEG